MVNVFLGDGRVKNVICGTVAAITLAGCVTTDGLPYSATEGFTDAFAIYQVVIDEGLEEENLTPAVTSGSAFYEGAAFWIGSAEGPKEAELSAADPDADPDVETFSALSARMTADANFAKSKVTTRFDKFAELEVDVNTSEPTVEAETDAVPEILDVRVRSKLSGSVKGTNDIEAVALKDSEKVGMTYFLDAEGQLSGELGGEYGSGAAQITGEVYFLDTSKGQILFGQNVLHISPDDEETPETTLRGFGFAKRVDD